MSTKSYYKFGVDVGNAAVKSVLLSKANHLIKEGLHQSAVATIADERYLTFGDPNTLYFQVIKSPLKHQESIFAVGDDAVALPNYKEYDVTSTSYKANHELTTALLFGTLLKEIHQSELPITPHIQATLAVSIPIVEAKTIGLTSQYETLLNTSHVIRIYTADDIQDITVSFTPVKVLNEGQAGFLGLLDTVDTEFQNTMNHVYQALGESEHPIASLEDFLIVDIGEGTTDLAVFRSKKFNPEYSHSVTKGYGTLLEDAIKNAAREGLTVESRKELQRTLTTQNKRREERRKLWESYAKVPQEAFVQTLLDTILKAYGARDYFDAIIFIGGGFTALTQYRLENGQLVSDSQLFDQLSQLLKENHKDADLVFGIPIPYARTINERGLMQVLTKL